MESEYDQKFEEMKMYIPFLENMIKRLESSSISSNPRQAQLDKIRSLRDLLMAKKKRMKMENLLKCEQVLVNLYAKVEQRDLRPSEEGEKISSEKDKTDLNAVRNKLKSIVKSKLNVQDSSETLPEIARASKTEEVCVPGSKEPALFQRRPNKGTTFSSPKQKSVSTVEETSPQPTKRNYTRVLHSPENDDKRWSNTEGASDRLLFSRRSPRRRTPSHSKRERKKSKQKGKYSDVEDLNITLKVPEESLLSLNTKDILSRIINCSDSDVDINTLRELRSQILGELKHTVSKDDKSDLILKSYTNKTKSNTKSDEMEDGELSDSESEIIKSIYSSIVLLEKDKNTMNLVSKTSDNEARRKIQICLVIDKEQVSSKVSTETCDQNNFTNVDVTDFQNYHNDKEHTDLFRSDRNNSYEIKDENKSDVKFSDKTVPTEIDSVVKFQLNEVSNVDITNTKENAKTTKKSTVLGVETNCAMRKEYNKIVNLKPSEESTKGNVIPISKSSPVLEKKVEIEAKEHADIIFDKKVDIPLLNLRETANKEVASEIDILQALKNEILSETSTALNTDVDTPHLHQPKITKVVNTVDVGSKKRISIENYKAKSTNPTQSFSKVDSISKDELCKKQSLKLTEKECERFNFLSKIALHDSSDDEDKSSLSLDDVYDNLAPKSPDHEDFADTGLKPPIIIPNDPVNKAVATTESDVDMRKLVSVPISTSCNEDIPNLSSINIDSSLEYSNAGIDFHTEVRKEMTAPLIDPRIIRDVNTNTSMDIPDTVLLNTENISRQIISFGGIGTSQRISNHNMTSNIPQFLAPNATTALAPNISPVVGPNMSPAAVTNISSVIAQNMALGMPLNISSCLTNNVMGNMTPVLTPNARSYEMTPSRLCIENEDFTKNDHVYTPMFSNCDAYETENSLEKQRHGWNKKENHVSVWEDARHPEKSRISTWKFTERHTENRVSVWESNAKNTVNCPSGWGDTGKEDFRKNVEQRIPVWEDSDIRNNIKSYQVGKVDFYKQNYNDRYRYDSRESYKRLDCPRTPIHSFGRQDCPSTPTPSFGRSDMPVTPTHSFGRPDCMQRTSANRYGVRSDPRRTRGSEYNRRDDDRERRYCIDRDYIPPYRSNQNNHARISLDSSRQIRREQSVGRYDRNELSRRSQYSESSIGHSYNNDYESDNFYHNRRGSKKSENDFYNQNKYNSDSYQHGYRDYETGKPNQGRSSSVRSSVVDSDNSENNLISIHSNNDRSLTMDVIINNTFQKHMTNDNDNFNARRRRAASVGRILDPEDIEKNLELTEKRNADRVQIKNKNFRRASSVGRELTKETKNFKDVKEDLRSFKLMSDIKMKREFCEVNENKGLPKPVEETSSSYAHMRKDVNESRSTVFRYLPKKNTRDPRIRSENRRDFKVKNDDRKSRWKSSKNYGIVYSSDNISKGILGSGYGVKNYKIPKIKRPSLDTDVSLITEKTKDTTNKDIKIDAKSIIDSNNASISTINKVDKNINESSNVPISAVKQESNIDPQNYSKDNLTDIQNISSNRDFSQANDRKDKNTFSDLKDNVEKRVTRSAKKKIINEDNLLSESASFRKTRKVSKSYFSDLDSDENSTETKQTDKKTENVIEDLYAATTNTDKINEVFDDKIKIDCKEEINKLDAQDSDKKESEIIIGNTCIKNLINDNIDVSVDDLETFSENVITESVVDNINALIADLDQDLDVNVPKSINNQVGGNSENLEQQTNTVFNINPVTSPTCNFDSLKSIESNTDLQKSSSIPKESESPTVSESLNIDCGINSEEKTLLQTQKNESDETTKPNCTMGNLVNCYGEKDVDDEAVVSTTEKRSIAEENIDSVTTIPDSTFNINEGNSDRNNREILPDSTGESENIENFSSDVSTKFATENQERKEEVSNDIFLEKKLLSLLQDKSKMKELISKLVSDISENDKIKKKLEKLSEIVSDDEENIQDNDKDYEKNAMLDNKNCEAKKIIDVVKDDIIEDNTESDVKIKKSILPENDADDTILNRNDNLSTPQVLLDNNLEAGHVKGRDKEGNDIENKEKENENLSQNSKHLQSDENTLHLKHDDILEEKEDAYLEDEKNLISEVNLKNKKNIKKKRSKNKRQFKVVKKKVIPKYELPKVKKPSRELKNLQDDVREFIKDDILSTTGIRMCRLAKLVNEKDNQNDEMPINDNEPVVVLQKCNNVTIDNIDKEYTKKNTVKEKDITIEPTSNIVLESKINKQPLSNRPGPKSKTRPKSIDGNVDPYAFETDSVNESNASESKQESCSDSENESISSQMIEKSEKFPTERKKKIKRKRGKGGWQVGIIKPKNRKKIESKPVKYDIFKPTDCVKIPDLNCFTDKLYCFKPNTLTYSCRLCCYTGTDIVPHYIKHHPHSEIPLSRLCPVTAAEAIKQCEEVNFQAISKMPSYKYTCRFCFKEIVKKKFILEEFFWHVVSMHTGEYKQRCSECIDTAKCPFNIDIPPPPENIKGQLLGYICGKCNFTQVSLENLKKHVINRHNDEQTEVYTINLSVLSKKTINNFLKNLQSQTSNVTMIEEPRMLRSTRSKQNLSELSDDETSTKDTSKNISEPIRNIQSKLTFEGDNLTEMPICNKSIKVEPILEINNKDESVSDNPINTNEENTSINNALEIINQQTPVEPTTSSDIFAYPHFKVNYTTKGLKEYVCCIYGKDNHYKTSLLISMKKHVQMKHLENWDGYCFLCKVIVTPQGTHRFKDCFNHYLDKHIDDLPIMDSVAVDSEQKVDQTTQVIVELESDNNSIKPYINVRPLSQLISTANESQQNDESNSSLPIIESVVSLGLAEQSLPSPNYPIAESIESVFEYKYEEAQADIMSKKHRVVLDAMMNHVNLVQIFKCAGKFCSFTTDRAEEALLHASTHMRIGGEHALCCAYCDYDASGNAIDLVTHVFKHHGCCPFVCGICFYRAAASQLVQAHINRVHPNSNASVLRTTVVTGSVDEDTCLPRKTAVPFYRCSGDHDTPNPCKFRTYTPGKFCEHLQLRHLNAKEFLCFICSVASPTPAELVRHLKTHGLKLYQCTWCVFGADNEPELLEHASAKHPCKQPKAFLRIITNKEGTAEFKVLPLAHLNKSNIHVNKIIPDVCIKNPVREAERALELEKLIGETISMIESVSTPTDSNTVIPAPNQNTTENKAQEDPSPSAKSQILPLLLSKVSVPPPITHTPAAKDAPVAQTTELSVNTSELLNHLMKPSSVVSPKIVSSIHIPSVTPVNKVEADPPREAPNVNISHVYCIDSDDDSVNENVIDLSEDTSALAKPEVENVIKKLDTTVLFKCSNCAMVMKTAHGLMRHMKSCYGVIPESILCAHCPMKCDRSKLITHYLTSHLQCKKNDLVFGFICPVCHLEIENDGSANEHFKTTHNQTHTKIIWKIQNFKPGDKTESYSKAIINQETRSKRKRSLGSKEKAIEPPEKIKKFGPQDIDKLPINPILDNFVYCSLCEFSTKVKLNMVRHLQLHAQQQPVPEMAPVNPVPHLETNERHFDKMLNLASSSIINRPPDKSNKNDPTPSSTQHIGLEAVGYPNYVPDRQRLTCGAKGCAYISVDENMLKCHWETLHSGTNDYHCVHCPPYQHLDKSRPLSASRIISHLKMHDADLYACSLCKYYHYNRQILEKHLNEMHKAGEVLIVREKSSSSVSSTSQAAVAAPTMDLKPWHCGFCQFKSLLRPEVVDHCTKFHHSKMQYKCAYCAFRTSNLENIPKHQSKSHLGKPEEILYYYYREGSIPDEADGTPCWLKQKQKIEASWSQTQSEVVDNTCSPIQLVVLPATVQKVDLTLVKKEIFDMGEETVSDLCKEYGEFCEPNGLKYKCPLCKNVTEDNEETMQSHLYEELKYRKWSCSVCSYKAFHKAGFKEHMQTEHHLQNHEPLELPVDNRIETWIRKLLEHQKSIIEKNKDKLAIQKAEIKRVPTSVSEPQKSPIQSTQVIKPQFKMTKELETLFGPYGKPSGALYCCPKCNNTFEDENDMRTHLENELNKIRWYCNNCSQTFQTYHEAQFHCKSTHVGISSRPVEAARDASLRLNWVESAMKSQKSVISKVRNTVSSTIQEASTSEQNENSLLEVRFEQQVTTLEEEMAIGSSVQKGNDQKQSDEQPHDTDNSEQDPVKRCSYCSYITTHTKLFNSHVLKHYGLKACSCPYCGLDGNRKQVIKHQRICHPLITTSVVDTKIPQVPPIDYLRKKTEDSVKSICLVCRKSFMPSAASTHRHDSFTPDFGKDGDIVVKCCVCSMLHKEVSGCFNHHKVCHPQEQVDYVFCKLTTDVDVNCTECGEKFPSSDELDVHISKDHPKKSNDTPSTSKDVDVNRESSKKRKSIDNTIFPPRKVARKSTTKQSTSFAKKSTTKLPFNTSQEGYSFYGSSQSSEDLDKSILIPFCNTMMPFTVRKLPEIFGNPVVNIEKLNR